MLNYGYHHEDHHLGKYPNTTVKSENIVIDLGNNMKVIKIF